MKYREAIAEGLLSAMRRDARVLVLGEGVADPKGIFGTTSPAAKQFPDRVIETPLSENMLTGACLGLALEGWKPVFVHARTDFIMLAMEHLVNTAAKWSHIHGDVPVNVVVRTLVGRGWGQGPNHSQAFHSMLAHVPGLRVLYPVHPDRVASWLDDALTCGQPTIILEPRRVYDLESIAYPIWEVPDVYLVTFGDVVLEAVQAAVALEKRGVKAQVHPIEDVTALSLPSHDAPAVIADTGHLFFGASAEAVARLVERGNSRVRRVGPPFLPLPTSVAAERQWYPSADELAGAAYSVLGIRSAAVGIAAAPDEKFRGPF